MRWILGFCFLAAAAFAQQLPAGPGKAETERVCRGCHEVARSVSLRQDKAGWATTVARMTSLGMKAADKDLELVTAYLAKNYPADAVPPVNVNKARAIDFESRLGMRRSQAAAVVRYRGEHGDFKSLADLKKVPGVDGALLEAKKDRLVF